MCIVYNTIGALSYIESHLVKNNLDEFNSISELINFEKDYHFNEQQIIQKHKSFIQNEKNVIEADIPKLIEEISKNKFEQNKKLKQKLDDLNQKVGNLFLPNSKLLTILKDLFLNIVIWAKIWSIPILTHFKIIISNRKQSKLLSQKNIRYEFVNTNFDLAVNQSSSNELQSLIRKRNVIREINNFIYGAIGEHKVENVLATLSDEYVLINDFTYSFKPAIFNSKENDYIKSIQIDHILISPSGVFLIETKNWNEHSIKDIDMRSPVKQVLRTNFALFKILADNKLKHRWGERKIPIRNIITFINNKPIEEFKFVKILSLNELIKYVTYFPPCFSKEEVEYISNFLLKHCDNKNSFCKLNI